MQFRQIDLLNERRFWVASVGSMWVLAAVVLLGQLQPRNRPSPPPVQRTMELVIEAIQLPAVQPVSVPRPVTPTPTPKTTPKVESPPPKESPRAELAPAPQPVATPAAPAVTAVAEPSVRTPQAPPPVPAVSAPATVAEVSRPAPPPAPVAPPTASVEAEFVGQLRAQLNASKRYPTGREASMQRPSGRVVVWFVLNRGGQLQDAGIAESSNSILLDNAALTTVRRASFPAWPDAAWIGQGSHRFTATLDFIPQS